MSINHSNQIHAILIEQVELFQSSKVVLIIQNDI